MKIRGSGLFLAPGGKLFRYTTALISKTGFTVIVHKFKNTPLKEATFNLFPVENNPVEENFYFILKSHLSELNRMVEDLFCWVISYIKQAQSGGILEVRSSTKGAV